jgi:hypothetical protein
MICETQVQSVWLLAALAILEKFQKSTIAREPGERGTLAPIPASRRYDEHTTCTVHNAAHNRRWVSAGMPE